MNLYTTQRGTIIMTKIKNTKKGMAKKTLSMSLVVAMLATSNVPVWAAEFSDGTDAAVATEAPAAETFSDEADAAPVVEDTTDVATEAAKSTTTGSEYTVNLSDFAVGGTAVSNNETVWGGELSANVDITAVSAIANATLKTAWQVNGNIVDSTIADYNPANKAKTLSLTADMTGKSITLFVYAEQAGKVAWSYTSDAITVKAKDINDFVTASATNPTYDGTVKKATVTLAAGKDKDGNTLTVDSALLNTSNYKIAYSGELTNVTGDKVTVTLTPTITGYAGQVATTYEIQPMQLDGATATISSRMKATLENTSYVYTGNTTGKVKKSDIKLVDKSTGVDLSNYLDVDSNGYVKVEFTSADNTTVGKISNVYVAIKEGQPETGNKNYKVVGNNIKTLTDNTMTVVARDLSTVDVSIADQQYTGSKVTINPSAVTLKDKTTGEEITKGALEITVPDNAIERGTGYVATIKPGVYNGITNKNITGSTTGTFSIYSNSISNAYFANATSNTLPAKEYTGEAVTYTSEELGALKILNNTTNKVETIAPADYEITYSKNTNAGTNTAKLIVTGKGSYAGSKKELTFTINPATVSATTAAEEVEQKNASSAKDYKDAMKVVVKAKNSANKEFTLVEGTDYTVTYEYEHTSDGNKVGNYVVATVTVTNKNFKGTAAASALTAKSKITAAILKADYIKLKENSFSYNGKPVTPDFDVVIDGKVINPAYYTGSFTNNINAGTATLTVTGDGDHYSGKASVNFTIAPVDASKLTGVIATKEYKGYSLEIPADEIYLTLDGNKIDVDSNFTRTFGENLNIGEGTVTLTPKNGNFTGSKTLTFQICGEMLKTETKSGFNFADKNGFAITGNNIKFSYDGTAQTFAKTTLDNKTGKTLTEGTDYEIKYVDNVYGQKGTNGQYAVVLAIAKGKYGGDLTQTENGIAVKNGVYTDAEGNKIVNVFAMKTIKIEQQAFTADNIAISNGTYAAGLPVKPQVKIVVKGVTLVEGKDYELDIPANSNVVNATSAQSLSVIIKGKNGYTTASNNAGITFKWGIDKFDLANADVTVKDGKISVKCGKVDVDASEYTTTANGDGTTTIKAVSTSKNYTGSKKVATNGTTDAEKPEAPMISEVKVTGNKATVVLSSEADGAAGYDYVISTDRDCITNKDYTSVNKNQVKTNTTFEYVGQNTYYAYCHAWKRDENGKKVFSDWSNAYPFVVSAITPSQPVITSVKVKGSTVTVTYTKASNADGYDVVLGTSTKKVNGETRPVEYGKLVKKNIKGNVVTATFKNVKKGTYYAGLHAFNRTSEDGKKVFSQWSNVKKVTVK